MTDIYSPSRVGTAAPSHGEPATDLRKTVEREDLIASVELLFFAYRDFTGEADAVLAEFGFGRAHHRVLHFVNRHPGLRSEERRVGKECRSRGSLADLRS